MDNTYGIREYSRKRNEDTIDKVNKVIDKMKAQNQKINFITVSEASGVAKATLYNNDILKERIVGIKFLQNHDKESLTDKKKLTEMKGIIRRLREEIKSLTEQSHKQYAQIVEVYELRQENKRLQEVINRANNITPLHSSNKLNKYEKPPPYDDLHIKYKEAIKTIKKQKEIIEQQNREIENLQKEITELM